MAVGYAGKGLYSGRGLYDGRGKYNIMKASRRWRHSKAGKELARVGKMAAMDALEHVSPEAATALRYAGKGMYTGRGTYGSNSLIAGGKPSMSVSGGGDNQNMTITHREYLQDVYGPQDANFNNSSLDINPGLTENFPWLSQLAANYEEYEIEQLVFEFHSTVNPSATNNTSGATGTIIMATNYNPDAPAFQTKEVMMQYHGAVSGRITDDMSHGVECDPKKNAGTATKYVRTAKPIGQSLKDFDLGKFQWAIVNIPMGFENQQIGEMWVYYTIRLQKPRLFSAVYRNLAFDQFMTRTGSNFPFSNPLGYSASDLIHGTQNSLNIAVSNNSSASYLGLTFTFPAFMTGTYEIVITVYCDTTQSVPVGTVGVPVCTGGVSNQTVYWTKGFNTAGSGQGMGYLNVIESTNFDPSGPQPTFLGSQNFTNTLLATVVPTTAGTDSTMSYVQNWGLGDGKINSICIMIKPINTTYKALSDAQNQLVFV